MLKYKCQNTHKYNIILINSILCLIAVLFLGCSTSNQITYFQDINQEEWSFSSLPPDHIIQVGDVLMIKVISRNEEINNMFNIDFNSNSSNNATTSANIYLNGFTVSENGTIDLPNIGEINLMNQSIDEAKKSILEIADDYIINPYVTVKLANFEVTVLGQVVKPGKYPIFKENITIFEAIAMAGDINDYGNLQNVKIIRTCNNKSTIYFFDLTEREILDSDFYYLQNQDLVYIEPHKFAALKKSQSQILFSGISTFAILLNVILNMSN